MIDKAIHLAGHLIVLRDWRISDLARDAAWSVPGHRWKDLDGPYYPLPTAQETAAFVARKRAEIEGDTVPHPRSSLAIADKATDEFLGLVTWYWESQETHWPCVGLVIYDPAHWGQGRGYDALGLWSDYLFHALPQTVRLDLRTWSGNGGMMRVAEKLGYQLEARFRQARIVNGRHYDGLGYGILRAEWARRYPTGFVAHLCDDPGGRRTSSR